MTDIDLKNWSIFCSYIVCLQASQKDNAYSSATVTLFVNVTDVENNLPKFHPVTYDVTLSEHSAAGSYITQVKATDKDVVNNDWISKPALKDLHVAFEYAGRPEIFSVINIKYQLV